MSLGMGHSVEEDRISKLPDDILVYILSSLETRHAVRTGAVSKRWKNLWCSVPDMVFDLSGVDSSESRSLSHLYGVISFIDKQTTTQLSPLPRCLLRKFSFNDRHYQLPADHPAIRTCVNTVVRAGVRHLCLELADSLYMYEMINKVLTCESLVDLELVFGCLYYPRKESRNMPNLKTLNIRVSRTSFDVVMSMLPSCPKLESLTITAAGYFPHTFCLFEKLCEVCDNLIHLKLVELETENDFSSHESFWPITDPVSFRNLKSLHLCVSQTTRYVSEKLFACCPNLESFTMLASYFQPERTVGVLFFKIKAPKLKHLVLSYDPQENHNCNHNVVIKAPLLETLHISGVLGIYLFLNSSSTSLVEAGLDLLQAKNRFELTGSWPLHILEKISGVKSLKIARSISKPLDHCIRCGSLCFPNLTRLELTGIHNSQILGLLQLTPRLEYLKLIQYDHGLEEPVDKISAPSCLLSKVKVIEVEESRYWRSRLGLIEYFLKNGKVLDKMTVDCVRIAGYEDPWKNADNHLPDDEIRIFETEVVKFLRCSSTCKIELLGRGQNPMM